MENKIQNNQSVSALNRQFSYLVDNRNRDLWKFLQEKYHFEIEESPEPGYLTYFNGDTVIIEVDVKEIDPAAFTHELLHVFMKAQGLEIVWDLREKVTADPELREILSTSLRVHIGNCLEHIKMLPLFLARKFAREDFLRDYHSKVMDMPQFDSLEKNYYHDGKLVMASVDRFIGKFFAMKASVNPKIDYEAVLEGIQKLDPPLFLVLNKFWQAWLTFQVGDPKEDYRAMMNLFLADLKVWKRNIPK